MGCLSSVRIGFVFKMVFSSVYVDKDVSGYEDVGGYRFHIRDIEAGLRYLEIFLKQPCILRYKGE